MLIVNCVVALIEEEQREGELREALGKDKVICIYTSGITQNDNLVQL